MRVNVSFSLKLDEVLGEVQGLYERENSKFKNTTMEVEKVLKKGFFDENLSEVLLILQEYREAIAAYDLKLSEIKGILSSYHNIKHSIPPQKQQEQSEETNNQTTLEE